MSSQRSDNPPDPAPAAVAYADTLHDPDEVPAVESDYLQPDDRVGRYVIRELLGAGGMGAVYRAHDTDLQRDVALKLLRPIRAAGSAAPEAYSAFMRVAQERLLREARAVARLNHPNVITVYETSAVAGRSFIAMEFVDGGNLADWLAAPARHNLAGERDATSSVALQRHVQDWHEVVAAFLQAARGLAAAHEVGIIHRDFKPANILFHRDGRVVVTDFGLACLPGDTALEGLMSEVVEVAEVAEVSADDSITRLERLTQTGMVMGTPAYMAPEQQAGLALDPRTDQFSFCVALHEALYGRRPFTGGTLSELHTSMSRGLAGPAPKHSSAPPALYSIVRRGLNIHPDDRYESMQGLIDALNSVRHRPRKYRTLAVGVIAAVITAIVLTLIFWLTG